MAQYNHNANHYEPDGYAGGYEGGFDGEPGFGPHGGEGEGEGAYDDADAVYEAGAGYGGEPGGYGAEPAGFGGGGGGGVDPAGYGPGNIGYGTPYDSYQGPAGPNYDHYSQEKRMLASVLAEAVIKLAEEKIGALITIERNVSLNEYTDLGVKIDGEVTSQLLQSIFIKSSPLHDGAVIIRLNRIECASTYFPLTNKKISSQFGSRHRAAIGISEQTDAVSVIVSETNGSVSIARSGKFLQVENLNNLFRILYDELASTKEMV